VNKLVIASNNPGKLREIAAILAPLEIEVVTQGALGVPEAEEPHCTFIENALAKARHASRLTGLPALAAPAGFSPGGLPAGIQIIGRRGAELACLKLAHAYEQAARPVIDRQPPALA
jgi:Asp-tRNA(Asn)/Glu-tRNA(Gln) amidotransferase A subunit family amidase